MSSTVSKFISLSKLKSRVDLFSNSKAALALPTKNMHVVTPADVDHTKTASPLAYDPQRVAFLQVRALHFTHG